MEMYRKFKLALLLILLCGNVYAAAPTRTYNYVSHTTIDPAQNNANENALYTYLQSGVDTYSAGSIDNTAVSSSAGIAYSKLNLLGSILNADVNTSAAIAYSKLNLSNSILNADINASAAIVDTKLATISTAGKVSGAALTSLSSTPSGAGIMPVANLGTTPTATTFLRGDGAFTIPGMTLVSTTTLSGVATSGSISMTSGNTYFINFNFVALSAADTLIFRFNGNSDTAYTATSGGVGTATSVTLSGSVINNAALGSTGTFYIQQIGTTSKTYTIWGDNVYYDNGTSKFTRTSITGAWNDAITATSFAILTSGGATMTGKVYLYQVATQ